MIQELVYTSAPKGLQPGSSGFCSVASSKGMAANLVQFLEGFSGYRHVHAPGTAAALQNPVASSYITAKIGGKKLWILSRVADAGLDYSGRSNKIAHHLVLDKFPIATGGPSWILSRPNVMFREWTGDPRILPPRLLPEGQLEAGVCNYWAKVTGDAGWAAKLLESWQNQRPIYIVYSTQVDPMNLINEGMALMPATERWRVTFSTYYTKIPPGSDCLWRFIVADSPEVSIARRSRDATFFDLSNPKENAIREFVEAAIGGTQIKDKLNTESAVPRTQIVTTLPYYHNVIPLDSDQDLRLKPPSAGLRNYPRNEVIENQALGPNSRDSKSSPLRRLSLAMVSIICIICFFIGSLVWLVAETRQKIDITHEISAPKIEVAEGHKDEVKITPPVDSNIAPVVQKSDESSKPSPMLSESNEKQNVNLPPPVPSELAPLKKSNESELNRHHWVHFATLIFSGNDAKKFFENELIATTLNTNLTLNEIEPKLIYSRSTDWKISISPSPNKIHDQKREWDIVFEKPGQQPFTFSAFRAEENGSKNGLLFCVVPSGDKAATRGMTPEQRNELTTEINKAIIVLDSEKETTEIVFHPPPESFKFLEGPTKPHTSVSPEGLSILARQRVEESILAKSEIDLTLPLQGRSFQYESTLSYSVTDEHWISALFGNQFKYRIICENSNASNIKPEWNISVHASVLGEPKLNYNLLLKEIEKEINETKPNNPDEITYKKKALDDIGTIRENLKRIDRILSDLKFSDTEQLENSIGKIKHAVGNSGLNSSNASDHTQKLAMALKQMTESKTSTLWFYLRFPFDYLQVYAPNPRSPIIISTIFNGIDSDSVPKVDSKQNPTKHQIDLGNN